MLYCNTVTVAATQRAGAGLGAQALGWACRRAGGRRARAERRLGRWGTQAWACRAAGSRARAERAGGREWGVSGA